MVKRGVVKRPLFQKAHKVINLYSTFASKILSNPPYEGGKLLAKLKIFIITKKKMK